MSQCPTHDVFERLLSDRIADTELELVEHHLEDCASCQQTLQDLSGDATWRAALRQEISGLLEDAEPDEMVDPLGVTAGALDGAPRIVPTVPGYEIAGELGRGGMGVVYQARHIRLNRPCALKMILAGAHAGAEHVARFITEAEAIARLEHPSIVQIRHIGDADRLPFLELEYLAGGGLDSQLDGTPWPASKAARLAEQLAAAIALAHRQGIVHRDLKPSNVLLAADGTPKIGDFGLAKLLDSRSALTQSESVMGSPSYMAPEQAEGHANRAGPAVDVYALGAILYELLTGRPPFRGTTPLETLEQVKTTEPVSPSRLVPGVPRDAETICLKCLQKEPGKRYETAEALGEDLRRFLDGRPVLARRTGGVERAWRWCRRNPWQAVAAALLFFVAVGATVAAFAFRAAGRQTQNNLLEALTEQASARRLSRQMGQRFESLRALERAAGIARELALPPEKFDRLRDQAIASLALPDIKATGRVIEQPAETEACCFDPGRNRYALRLWSGTILVRRVADDREIARFETGRFRDSGVFCFSPDGRYLATTQFRTGVLTVWDVDRNSVAASGLGPVAGTAAQFSPDSRRIALAHSSGDVLIHEIENPGRSRRGWSFKGTVQHLAFRGDGRQIAVTTKESKPVCHILEVDSGQVVRTIPMRSNSSVAWSPDGLTLAMAGDDFKIGLWDIRTGIARARLEGSTNGGVHAAFHPAGTLLASDGWDGRLRLWDAVLGRPVLSLTGYDPAGNASLVVGADGKLVLVSEGRLTTYQIDPALEYRALVHVSREPIHHERPSIRHDNLLAVGSTTGVVLWDLESGTECAYLPIGSTWHIMFDANGDLLTSGATGLWRWPVRLDTERGQFRIGPPSSLPFSRASGQFDEDRAGRVTATARGNHVEVLQSGRVSRIESLDDCRYVAVSPDGQWLATGSHNLGTQVWRASDASKEADLPVRMVRWLAFSPDGKWLMTGNPPCRLWSTGTWTLARELGGAGVCFSSDSRLIAVQDASQIIRLIEVETGRVIARLESPDPSNVNWATFSPDGSRLVVVSENAPAVRVWNLRAIRQQLAGIGLDWDAPALRDVDGASRSALALRPFHVDLGPLAGEVEHFTGPPHTLVERFSAQLKDNPNDDEAYHHRGHAWLRLGRFKEAIDDFTVAFRVRPDDAHLRLALADACNREAWDLVRGSREPERAVELARRAIELAPEDAGNLNTLGVALYRAGRFGEAIQTLERSLAASPGEDKAFDLYFLAMAHHRQGRREHARACLDRGVRWADRQNAAYLRAHPVLPAFRAEAESVLAGPAGELPDDVFVPSIEQPSTKRR
jgi:eukaryotic-like serine/threonine-protein kinase